jgi:ADP-heptose:LPS heptosyltransferase
MSKPLVVRLRNWVGDVVLCTPSLVALEQSGFKLTLVGKRWAQELFSGYEWQVLTKAADLRGSVGQLAELRRQLRNDDPTFNERLNAIVYPTSFSSALEMRLAGLKAIGYAQEARGFLLRKPLKITYGGHALVSYWDLTQSLLGTQQPPPNQIGLKVSAANQATADMALSLAGVRQPFLCAVPFAGGTFEKLDKKWPHFPELVKQLAKDHQIVICPGPGEEPDAIANYPRTVIIPKLTLGAYLGVLRRANVVISNDTGPGHMAAAVGTPVISVLGPTKPEQWAPWGPGVRVVRGFPEWPTVERVYTEVMRVLNG